MSLRKFQVSAPGKIILHGEHSVVYNKAAIAGPISLRTYFNFEETSDEIITLQYERLNLTATLKISKANALLADLDCNDSLQPMEFLKKIRNSKNFIINYLDFEDADERKLSDKEEMAVCATLYIFNRILRAENVKTVEGGFIVKIDSDMSIGAGVGSSASYGVCLAGGFYAYSQILNKKFDDNFSFNSSPAVLERISQWAFDSEVIMHEKPSGIDNTICTYGQLIRFVRGQTPELINMNGRIDILLVDTGVSRSTSHVVAKVANFKNKYSNLANSIFDAIGYLVDDVVTILRSTRTDKFQELSLLVSVNNNLLRSLDVSHPRLEKLFHIAESHGFNSKLTGAGGGGCAFVLLPPNYEQMEKYSTLCDDFKENNYQVMATHIIDGIGVTFKNL